MTGYKSAGVRIRVLRNLMQVQNYDSSKWEVKDYRRNLGFTASEVFSLGMFKIAPIWMIA